MESGMSEDTSWRRHEPVMATRGPVGGRTEEVIGCTGCGWRSDPEISYSSAGFGGHLEKHGAPDFIVGYWRFWADIVEVPFLSLNREQVAKELFDYEEIMKNASSVFSELADLSKPNTAAHHVINGARAKFRLEHAQDACEQAWELWCDGECQAALALIRMAQSWNPGAWREFADDHRRWRSWRATNGV